MTTDPYHFSIDPMGCRVTELVLNGKTVFWSGLRPDGKQASTHPCLPHFGQVTTGPLAQLPQHGPARNETWILVGQEKSTEGVRYKWEMQSVEGVYSKGLVAYRTFELTENLFTLTTSVHNHGSEVLPINPGEHCYFAIPYTNRGLVKVNGQLIPDIWPETYYGSLKTHNTLDLPGIGKLQLMAKNFKHFAAWSVPGAEFICIEPIWDRPETVNQSSHRLHPNTKIRFILGLTLS